MANLYIHDIPDDLYDRFERFAQKHHRSLSVEVIYLIEQAVAEDEQLAQRRAALARIVERRRQLPPTPPDALDSLTILREDQD